MSVGYKWDAPTLDRLLYLITNMDGEDLEWEWMAKGGSDTEYLAREDVLKLLERMKTEVDMEYFSTIQFWSSGVYRERHNLVSTDGSPFPIMDNVYFECRKCREKTFEANMPEDKSRCPKCGYTTKAGS